MKTRRWLAVASALLLCAAICGQLWAGAAGEPLDLTRECQLVVNPCDMEANRDMAEDLAQSDTTVVVDLYRVSGVGTTSGGSFSFAPIDPYNLEIPQDITNTGWAQLAQQAAGVALQPTPRMPDYSVEAGTQLGLQPGVYLLIAHGQGDENYVQTIAGADGSDMLVTQVRTEQYVYSFAPELVVLPSRAVDESGLATGEWQYQLNVNLKPQRDERKAGLEIVKTLLSYEDSGPATFVFLLEWELNGERHSDVRSITFDDPGQKVLLVEDLPVGATVTVTEVYSGAHYTVVGDDSQTVVIEAGEPARLEFVNDYDERNNEGGSITNRFSYNGESWDWQPIVNGVVTE